MAVNSRNRQSGIRKCSSSRLPDRPDLIVRTVPFRSPLALCRAARLGWCTVTTANALPLRHNASYTQMTENQFGLHWKIGAAIKYANYTVRSSASSAICNHNRPSRIKAHSDALYWCSVSSLNAQRAHWNAVENTLANDTPSASRLPYHLGRCSTIATYVYGYILICTSMLIRHGHQIIREGSCSLKTI